MKTIALISGGKDSILSVMLAMRYGHEPIVVANVAPVSSEDNPDVHEIDSYSFQTVGHEVVESIAICLQLPLRRAFIRAGQAHVQSMHYALQPDKDDEIEVLYRLLRDVKSEFPEVEAVTSGAILSNYQRYRVEHVCRRLGLRSLAFLWQRPAEEILDMAAALRVRAVLVKTATVGLDPRRHIGEELQAVRPELERAQRLYGAHGAGEGGEFETIVLDCPLFRDQCLEITGLRRVIVDDNEYAPSGHACLNVVVRDKSFDERAASTEVLHGLQALTFPSDRMTHLPQAAELRPNELFDPSVIVTTTDTSTLNFWGCKCDVYASGALLTGEEFGVAAEGLLQSIVNNMAASKREVFFLNVRCPSIEYVTPFDLVYEQYFPAVRPPCMCYVEVATEKCLLVEVLSSPCGSIDREVMHVQSTSCWCVASLGSYSLSNRVTLEECDEQRIIVSGVIGLVPSAGKLASVSDLPGLELVLLSEIAHAMRINEDTLRRFIVEFAFMYANSFNGLTCFDVDAVTHATFFLRDTQLTPLLPFLWKWCTKEKSVLTPMIEWLGSPPKKSQSGKVFYRVFEVTKLQCDAMIQVILEHRAARQEDD